MNSRPISGGHTGRRLPTIISIKGRWKTLPSYLPPDKNIGGRPQIQRENIKNWRKN